MFKFDREAYEKRVDWFKKARFGMFIHWGLYSIPARGEWIRSVERISIEDYQKYFDEFNPVDYDPKKWARACKQAGMQYAVLTAKHHDGFCLFDSKLTDYNSVKCCGRDLVREYLDAFRTEGIRVGLYYSIIDWHHPDFPHYGDKQHPMRDNPDYKDYQYNFDNYLEYMHGQIKELCTNYGKIDIFWFDFSYDDMRGEKWKATELVRMIRSYQPDVLMDNRLEVSGDGFGSLVTQNPSEYCGDFVSPEQIIPPEGVVDDMGKPVVWESCITMNNHWGYASQDDRFKTADIVIRKLVECVSKGGNLLLNVGPDARGNIPEKSLEILRNVGDWMRLNGESIYGCGRSLLPRPDYGRITQSGKNLYFHVNEAQVGFVPLVGVRAEDVKCIRLLKDGSEMPIERNWMTGNYPDIVFVSFGDNPQLPDPVDTVIKVELK
ncbi:MAG: alpha-L-fucosidase [Candidatus Fimadaptatus sp.]|jgi:alpha-L-fucosidase